MSISVGVYDFFAYTLPGGLYLLFLWLLLKRLGVTTIPLATTDPSIAQAVVIGTAAYLLGLIAAPLSWNRWFLIFGPRDAPRAAFERVKKIYPDVSFGFSPPQWPVLEARLAREHGDILNKVDKFRATYIMLRSTCFALVLLALLQMFSWVGASSPRAADVLSAILMAAVLLFLSAIAARSSHRFANWSYSLVYELTIAGAMKSEDLCRIGGPLASRP